MKLMNICPICGCENSDENINCSACGSKLVSVSSDSEYTKLIQSKNSNLAIILSVILPGFSYFYLKQWYKGILFFLLFPLLFVFYSLIYAFYRQIGPLKVDYVALLLMITYFVLYVLQIIDIIKQMT